MHITFTALKISTLNCKYNFNSTMNRIRRIEERFLWLSRLYNCPQTYFLIWFTPPWEVECDLLFMKKSHKVQISAGIRPDLVALKMREFAGTTPDSLLGQALPSCWNGKILFLKCFFFAASKLPFKMYSAYEWTLFFFYSSEKIRGDFHILSTTAQTITEIIFFSLTGITVLRLLWSVAVSFG